MSTETLLDREYLGDGVYVGHDGWNVVLWLDEPGAFGPNAIALEPSVVASLDRYLIRLAATPTPTGPGGPEGDEMDKNGTDALRDVRWAEDGEWEEYQLDRVRESADGYELGFDDGLCFWCPRVESVVPKVGDTIRLFGRGFGYTVRGLLVNGRVVFYRTEAEQEEENRRTVEESRRQRREEFEKNRAKLDADYDALPPIFQARVDKFRRNNPDFRWEYEDYEMFCCTQAVLLAQTLGSVEAIRAWDKINSAEHDPPYDYKAQVAAVPGWSDEHSGNTHGMAVALACWYLTQPEAVERMHGALAPLVGSAEYGCVPRTT